MILAPHTIGLSLLLTVFALKISAQQLPPPLWKNDQYAIYSDRVVQGSFTAQALSPTHLISDYKSPANLYQSTKITFKFSINGKDNEMQPGTDHHFNVLPGIHETPVIHFGQPLTDSTADSGTYLGPETPLRIRVDMNRVLSDFKTKGFFTTFRGDRIYPNDFKGLYVAGNTLPLFWDFDNLHTKKGLELKDPDGDGIYETTLMLNAQEDAKQTDTSWKMTADTRLFPQYESGSKLADAIYNMSLEEMMRAVEPDSTFRTGKEWAGVWTRDISYSIMLAMAYLQPEVAKKSLLRKVNRKKRIIQDTGTGGAYPCSTDRMIWAVAAWEIFKATGDEAWLREAFDIIRNSVEDDRINAWDPHTGLLKGESSFLDWREQTYPRWMQPADIYESLNLGTNAVHYQAHVVLAEMAIRLNKPQEATRYRKFASAIRSSIQRYLWLPGCGYFAQYLYGRHHKLASPRTEALGEALSVLFDIAGPAQQSTLIGSVPQTPFGIPCVYPQLPGIPPYHNNAVWPFVQSYWALAAAKAGNEAAVMASIAAIWRPAALFLTNKENLVAENGDFAGTVINSSNMLWSLSGNLALVHKLLFGIQFNVSNIALKPFVPRSLQGKRILRNFRYRGALLDFEMEGYGDVISQCTIDGRSVSMALIPASLQGKHVIRIQLANRFKSGGSVNQQQVITAPATPSVSLSGTQLSWQPVSGAMHYRVVKNGQLLQPQQRTHLTIKDFCAAYQIIAVDSSGSSSHASEPVTHPDCNGMLRYEAETFTSASYRSYKGYSGNGFIELSTTTNRAVMMRLDIPVAGKYALCFRYANGNGPVNTENKCAIRSLFVGKKRAGVLVFPQRGTDEWSNWGFSNSLPVMLQKGKQIITLCLEDANDNMHETINEAMLDYLQLVPLE